VPETARQIDVVSVPGLCAESRGMCQLPFRIS
jgi:hypothetical protein